jgi:ABC-type multidrug transport system fused ATPase/permease subunit
LTPGRYLLALLRARLGLAASAVLFGALWALPIAALPLVIGNGIEAIAGENWPDVWFWTVAAAVLGILQSLGGTIMHFAAFGMWLHGAGSTQRVVSAHAARLGASLRDTTTTGNVVAVTGSDINYIGNLLEVLGRTAGSAITFVVAGIALLSTSPLLGVVALVGVPLAVLGIGPLLAPLQRRKAAQREQLSDVTALGADIVSGLRILRGVGGEKQFLGRFRGASQRVRLAGVEVGRSEAWLAAAEIALPGLVTVAITWLGARLAVGGSISVGELVAFYGVSAFLVIPVTTATEAAGSLSSGLVSARKICGILGQRPKLTDPADPIPLPPGPLELHDSETGVTVPAGELTVIDAGAEAEALADRLARFTDAADGEEVLVGGVPVRQVSLAELRRRVVYAHNQDIWFSGILREQVSPARPSEVGVAAALFAADADDIVEALPDGVEELIGERGREVSGGQRQRLNLARALAIDADVLVLDEPTSAVDAHTEARITERVARLRRGKTTVVFSQSPLWTSVADQVLSSKVWV